MSEEVNCEPRGEGVDSQLGLRIGAIFVILVGATGGALFPVLASRSKIHVPKGVFEFAKYFGSGVIIATAFIHLLAPALEALGSECLSEAWHQYPYALAISMLGIFIIFIVELMAFRWGTAKLAKLGITHDAHGHAAGSHVAHGPETLPSLDPKKDTGDVESRHTGMDEEGGHRNEHGHSHSDANQLMAQLIGVAILEFGVVLHSILIGLALAVDESFKILFVVVVFHQTFEGLGIGARLAMISFPKYSNSIPILAALLYGITTPVGMAAGLGIRTYNPDGATASIVSGVLDAFASGILMYTGLVELIAHDFLFNKEMMQGSNKKLAFAIGSMVLGWGLMALLGRWA